MTQPLSQILMTYAEKDSELIINLLNDELEKNKLPVTCVS